MRLKFVKVEDFINYKKPSIFLGTCFCDFKCCKEQNLPISTCQNEPWSREPIKDYNNELILKTIDESPIIQAIVFGGMEPFQQFPELVEFLKTKSRWENPETRNMDVVIYTGYNLDELEEELNTLKTFPNIYLKLGRFQPGHQKHYDEVLGISLSSDNQYGIKLT